MNSVGVFEATVYILGKHFGMNFGFFHNVLYFEDFLFNLRKLACHLKTLTSWKKSCILLNILIIPFCLFAYEVIVLEVQIIAELFIICY